MQFTSPLSLLLTLCVLSVARAHVSVPITSHVDVSRLREIASVDRARSSSLRLASKIRASGKGGALESRFKNAAITNGVVSYTIELGVGTPPTDYKLLVDTGSSNTWIGAGKAYTKTSTSVDTKQAVAVQYGSGSFSGEEYTDTVQLSPHLIITKQSIGVANLSKGLDRYDGILGVGPDALTKGTVTGAGVIKTVTTNLFQQGTIEANALGMYLAPSLENGTQGFLSFGGPDNSLYEEPLRYTQITNTSPASQYVGIDASFGFSGLELDVGGDLVGLHLLETPILNSTAGIVDSGTSLILLATEAFKAYQSVTEAVIDNATGLLSVTNEQFDAMRNLLVNVDGVNYPLTPDAQRFPAKFNSQIGGQPGKIYLVINDLGSHGESGLDFILGMYFLQRFYHVYDAGANRVGFARTQYTTQNIS
ncbi:acid protease [Auriculariales sp. MPI-PUGE-AT-0066]|nr:acid protease [Auriculariales sp. MPI-PUGE-AT-0066]